MRQITELVQRHVDERRQSGRMKPDLISHFLTGTDPKGRHLTDIQVRDQVLTTFVAGQENSALALAWFWYMLSQHPWAQERVHAELEEVLGGRPATQDDIPKLSFTRRVFEETLRLYPVLWVIPRIVQTDDVIGGYPIPAGSTVIINAYLTHRHPDFWDRPEEFDPDRLLPERVKGLARYAYIPFGGGKRKCIGNEFAMLASLQFIATIAQRYRVEMAGPTPIEPYAVSTLRPKDGMPVRIVPRSS
jgi:cytochrome P450